MATRGRPRQFDRDRALHLATQVFWAKGYEGTSLSELQEAMGLSRPSVYAAFGDKDSLFREAVAYYRRTDGAILLAKLGLEQPGSAKKSIAEMLRAYALLFTEPGKGKGCLVVLGAINCTPERSVLSEELAEIRRATSVLIRSRLEREVERQELPSKTNVGDLAQFFTAVLNSLSIQARDGASREQLLAVVASAMLAWPPGQPLPD